MKIFYNIIILYFTNIVIFVFHQSLKCLLHLSVGNITPLSSGLCDHLVNLRKTFAPIYFVSSLKNNNDVEKYELK